MPYDCPGLPGAPAVGSSGRARSNSEINPSFGLCKALIRGDFGHERDRPGVNRREAGSGRLLEGGEGLLFFMWAAGCGFFGLRLVEDLL